jgi:hypothetical protein
MPSLPRVAHLLGEKKFQVHLRDGRAVDARQLRRRPNSMTLLAAALLDKAEQGKTPSAAGGKRRRIVVDKCGVCDFLPSCCHKYCAKCCECEESDKYLMELWSCILAEEDKRLGALEKPSLAPAVTAVAINAAAGSPAADGHNDGACGEHVSVNDAVDDTTDAAEIFARYAVRDPESNAFFVPWLRFSDGAAESTAEQARRPAEADLVRATTPGVSTTNAGYK